MVDASAASRVHQIVSERRGWSAEDYVVSPLPDWPQERLRILRAEPRQRLGHAPVFVVGSDGTIASQWDSDPLSIAVRQAFLPVRREDAALLVRLALMFGKWSDPIGVLVTGTLPVDPDAVTKPLRPLEPQMALTDGGAILRFYTYDPELRDLFDARVEVGADGTAQVHAELLVEGTP